MEKLEQKAIEQYRIREGSLVKYRNMSCIHHHLWNYDPWPYIGLNAYIIIIIIIIIIDITINHTTVTVTNLNLTNQTEHSNKGWKQIL